MNLNAVKSPLFLLFTLLVGLTSTLFGADQKLIPANSKVHVRELGEGLDSYPKAEILKHKLAVVVINDEAAADFVIGGVGSSQERKWHEGLFTRTRDNHMGAIEIFKRGSQEIIWASEAGDRSMWWGAWSRDGYRKVASRLAKSLEQIISKR
jgi:hypothetical protein